MNQRYQVIINWSDEDQVYIAEVPELPGCMADGATRQEALANAEVVIQERVETARELGRPIPPPQGNLLTVPGAAKRLGLSTAMLRRYCSQGKLPAQKVGQCVATVVRGSGAFTPSGTVTWATDVGGSFDPSSCTLSGGNGTATCQVTYTPSAVGGGSHSITATYPGDANFYGSNGNQAVTVNKKDASVTPDDASKVIGDPDPVLTGTLTGFLPADNVTATYSRAPGETVGDYTISATLSPEEVLSNYNITYHTGTFTINPRTERYLLTIDVVGQGTVTKDPDATDYEYGAVVTLTPIPDEGWSFGGWSENVVDGQVTITGDTTVTATFTKDNSAPSFTSDPVTSVDEDALYIYNITATDPNSGDTLTITAPTKPDWLVLTDNGDGTALLTGTPADAQVGSHDVVLQVSDGELFTEQPFTIVVANVNDAPFFTSDPVTSAMEGELYTYNITTADPDVGDTLVITAPVLPAWLIFTDNGDGTATLTGTPANENVGVNNVTLNVSDGMAGVDQIFAIDVGNTNQGPSFTSEPVTSVDEDTLYTYNITATDPDEGATLIITAPTLPAWLTFTDNGDGTALLTGTPANDEVGDHVVALQVSDGVELASQSFTITVNNVNDAPVLDQPLDQSDAKGDEANLQLSATDVDAGAILTYSAEGLPGGLTLDPVSGLISGTITGDAGPYTVTVTVDDGQGGTDSKTFTWTATENTYTLNVEIVGNGSVTKDPDQDWYLNGTEVTLTAIPDEGWTFDGWSENVVDGKVIIDGDTVVTATFIESGPVVLPAGKYDDTDPAWSYTGDWFSMASVGSYADTLHYSSMSGNDAQVTFSGRQIQLAYIAGPISGIVDVKGVGSPWRGSLRRMRARCATR